MSLRRFQKQFITNALNPGIDVAALSIPRGNGKSWLAAYLLTRCLTPTDPLFVQGAEYLLCAASIEQARLCYRFVRADLEPTGEYRFIDSVTRLAIVHKATNTRLRVLSSNGKTAMGIVNCPLLVADEPGSWEVTGGQLMNDAIETAIGKPNSDLKVVYIGTLAPGTGGWWHDLIESGTRGSTYVQALQGDPEKWDQWSEIKRVNPLTAISPSFRRRLIQERDDARGDTRLKARFLSYRLNVPSTDESKMLLEVADWELMTARTVPERRGSPIVGIDLGGGRAWSSAVAVWENGRVEALALAPGIPDIASQEKRDRVPAGLYQRLVTEGTLTVAEGLRVQPPALLWELIRGAWGIPALVICDRFRLQDLQDAIGTAVIIEPRITRWSDAAADIRALRKAAKDGPLSVEVGSRSLLIASLAAAHVKSDDAGNTRLEKFSTSNCCRDDVAAALTLCIGGFARYPAAEEVASTGPILV